MAKNTSRRQLLATIGMSTGAGIVGLAGCVQQQSDSPDDSGESNQGENGETTTGTPGNEGVDGPVKVGVLSPVSGPFSPLGKGQRQAAKLAVKHVNESDSFDFQVEPVYEDTKTDPSAGRQMASKVVEQNGASFVAGGISSSVSLSISSYAKENEVVFTTGGAALDLTGSKCNEYTFRNESNTAIQAAGLVDYAVENLGDKWWLHTADYAYGNSAITEIKNRIDDLGADIDIVGTTKPQMGTKDFAPQISKIANSDAEVLAIPLTGGGLINFLKQADKQGLKEEVDIIGTANFANLIRKASGSAAVGTYSATLYNPKVDTGDNEQFVSAYKDTYGSPPGSFARVGYEAVRMTCRGIQEANSTDPTVVKNALSGLEMTTILGDSRKFRSCDHQATNPVWSGKIVEADSGKVPEVEVLKKIPASKATPPCEASSCSL
jgi:branched-chain amino acid transport system substrate-binding protein